MGNDLAYLVGEMWIMLVYLVLEWVENAFFLVKKETKKHFPTGNSPLGGVSGPIKGPPVNRRNGCHNLLYLVLGSISGLFNLNPCSCE